MLFPGTQMHIVTFIFIAIELVMIVYHFIYYLARPENKTTLLSVILLFLLLLYNISGGLYPDKNMPGSEKFQLIIAYGTGFITPSFFPYYVYKVFNLTKMKFHAFLGVIFFFIVPYLIFISIYLISGDINIAKNIFIVPLLNAIAVIYSLTKSIRHKYNNNFKSKASKEEIIIMYFSLTPWVGLPIIDYFNLGQLTEASLTNSGFLLLLWLNVKRHITQTRTEHAKLIESEALLKNWNQNLQNEIELKTNELKLISDQKTNLFINLAHETKTPLTLIKNYLDEYMLKHGSNEELNIIKTNVDKTATDIGNFFDVGKISKDFDLYNHNEICHFSKIVADKIVIFEKYCHRKNIVLHSTIQPGLYIKAAAEAIDRLLNNIIENAIKFSPNGGSITITLKAIEKTVTFIVSDEGIGIDSQYHNTIFEPYSQLNQKRGSLQGMGLGLSIVKNIVDALQGKIIIDSNPAVKKGTAFTIVLPLYENNGDYSKEEYPVSDYFMYAPVFPTINAYNPAKATVLIVEDNDELRAYMVQKLNDVYNLQLSVNGSEALTLLNNTAQLPNLIITDIMMDVMDGFEFATIIAANSNYQHIPLIFLSAKSTKADKLAGLQLGAIDFIEKPFSAQELLQKANSIIAKNKQQQQAIMNYVLEGFGKRATNNNIKTENNNIDTIVDTKPAVSDFDTVCKLYKLTEREIEIVRMLCIGCKNKEIASALFIADTTIQKHVQNIYQKLEVKTRIQLKDKLKL